MADFPTNLSYRVLPDAVLRGVGELIRRQEQPAEAVLLTEADISQAVAAEQRFWLLAAPDLAVLLVSQPCSQLDSEVMANEVKTNEATADSRQNPSLCRVGLTFDIDVISTFLAALAETADLTEMQRQQLAACKFVLGPSTAIAQSEFTLSLLEIFSQASGQPDSSLMCQPVRLALSHQQDKSLLLNQVISKIQESLDLSVILETTVAEVRQFLQADRLLIYQFDAKKSSISRSMAEFQPEDEPRLAVSHAHHNGYITYESLAHEELSSVLHYAETYCFNEKPECRQRYLEGSPFAVSDVMATYCHVPCLLAFLKQAQVQSKLVAPIIVNQQLWGLLIAHQCFSQRQWQPWELEFLQHIAEHLAIAINQAQLYQQLQAQTQNLEICVIERTQDLRDALAAAQSASRAKSEFLATMSHELRTPLTCIIGMSATLLRWSLGDLSPRQRDYLNTIHDSGEHLLALINDILEVSKIESGRTILEVSEFSLSSLARQSFDSFRREASEHDIQLALDFKVSSDRDLFPADPRRVRQILNNLLSNAIKFTPPGGKVTLRVKIEQEMVVFQIEDTGIGIPEAQKPLLFEKFQQLENARQRRYQGTGLGLALTKQLVDLHDGSITVNSKVGTGSIFTVRLPAQRLGNRTTITANSVPTVTEPIVGRIILVEDNEDSAGIICDMLTAADYQVIWVIDGSRVLEQVELLQPTAVITNVNLGSADGFDVIRSLHEEMGAVGIKILALVDGARPEQATAAHQAGAHKVLTKPIAPQKLISTMVALMSPVQML